MSLNIKNPLSILLLLVQDLDVKRYHTHYLSLILTTLCMIALNRLFKIRPKLYLMGSNINLTKLLKKLFNLQIVIKLLNWTNKLFLISVKASGKSEWKF